MDGEVDYANIQDALSLSHNQKLIDLFNEDAPIIALRFPRAITENDLIYRVACFLTPKAKTRKEILAKFDINKSKLNRVLSTLSPYLEKRGNNAIGLFYQIDPELIEQHSYNNKGKVDVLIEGKDNSNSNKRNKTSSQTKRVTIIEKEKVTSTTKTNIKKVVTTLNLLIISHFFIKSISFLTLFI